MNNVFITIKKELRTILRDKKSLMMMLITPIMIPLFIFIFSYVYDKLMNTNENDKYYVGINYNLNDIEKNLISENLEIKYYENKDDMQKAYETNKIDAYVIKTNENYDIYVNDKTKNSSLASNYFANFLSNYNDYLAQNYLSEIGADFNKVYKNITYNYVNLSGSDDLINTIVTMGFIFAVMAISLTAIYTATDIIASEKERGTLETILTFPIKNEELIIGKYLSIVISCLITSIISIVLTVVSFIIASKMFNIYNEAILNFNFSTITMGLLIMFTFSIFVSGLCIFIASKTKSYKEAQSSLTPVSLFTMIPMILDTLGIKMNLTLSLIPIVNHATFLKMIFCQTIGKNDIMYMLVMFISTIIYSVILIILISKDYKTEKVLFSN